MSDVLSLAVPVVMSLATAGVLHIYQQGRKDKRIEDAESRNVKLESDLEELRHDFDNHAKDNNVHFLPQVHVAQGLLLDQRLQNLSAQIDSRAGVNALRIEQLVKQVQDLDTKADRSLAVNSALSAELHEEIEKIVYEIGELREKQKR